MSSDGQVNEIESQSIFPLNVSAKISAANLNQELLGGCPKIIIKNCVQKAFSTTRMINK